MKEKTNYEKNYGSLQNRLEEGKNFVEEIKVGMGVTEYFYSDRKPYEVVEVIDQNNIVIRAMDYKRIDNEGMSDYQEYQYISNPRNYTIKITLRNNVWYRVNEYNKETLVNSARNIQDDFKTFEAAYNYVKYMTDFTKKQYESIELGKTIKKYTKMNISIGKMQKYFDYSF